MHTQKKQRELREIQVFNKKLIFVARIWKVKIPLRQKKWMQRAKNKKKENSWKWPLKHALLSIGASNWLYKEANEKQTNHQRQLFQHVPL